MLWHCPNGGREAQNCAECVIGGPRLQCRKLATENGPAQQYESTLEEALKNARLPVPLGSTPLWAQVVFREWTDVCGFVKPPNSHSE